VYENCKASAIAVARTQFSAFGQQDLDWDLVRCKFVAAGGCARGDVA